MNFNLAVILGETAAASPDKPVALHAGGQLTYGELDDMSDRLAAGLELAGLRPGARWALQLPNIPQFLIAYFGILKAGGVVVPLNVMLKAPEVAFQLGTPAPASSSPGQAFSTTRPAAPGGRADRDLRRRARRAVTPAPSRSSGFSPAPANGHRLAATRAGRHRRDRLHLGDDRAPQGRRADPHPAVHERRYPRAPLRCPARRRGHHGASAVSRLRPVQHPERVRAVRLHHVARPALRPGRGAHGDPAGQGHHLRGRAGHVRRPARHPALDDYDVSSLRVAISGGDSIPRRCSTPSRSTSAS